MAHFEEWMQDKQNCINKALDRTIQAVDFTLNPGLKEAMLYATTSGGKRIRPLLVFAASELGEADQGVLETAGVAVELVHIYSLIHDDLPCMDNDNLRHGKPTLHVKYDEAVAVLVGDGLQCLAFDILSNLKLNLPPANRLALLQCLSSGAGPNGMVGGQYLDLQSTGEKLKLEELEFMQKLKTGSLIKSAIEMGGICTGRLKEKERLALLGFANKIGRVFQVVDDLLDAEGSTLTLGKTSGKDIRDSKPNFVSFLGVDRARDYAATLQREAIEELAVFSGRGQRLADIAHFIIDRKF